MLQSWKFEQIVTIFVDPITIYLFNIYMQIYLIHLKGKSTFLALAFHFALIRAKAKDLSPCIKLRSWADKREAAETQPTFGLVSGLFDIKAVFPYSTGDKPGPYLSFEMQKWMPIELLKRGLQQFVVIPTTFALFGSLAIKSSVQGMFQTADKIQSVPLRVGDKRYPVVIYEFMERSVAFLSQSWHSIIADLSCLYGYTL